MSYPTIFTTPGVRAFAEEIDAERQRQLAKFGDQHHRDGTGPDRVWAFTGPALFVADNARQNVDQLAAEGDGSLSWLDIALEEFAEAAAESDPAKLRAELVQVAAVCAAWIADLDGRALGGVQPEPVAAAPLPFADRVTGSPVNDMRELYALQHAIRDAGGELTRPVHKAIDALREVWDRELRRVADETAATATQAVPVQHAPGKAIRCPDCRTKGYTICLDEPDAGAQQDGAQR